MFSGENRPGIYNLLAIYELFTGLKRLEIEAKFADKGYAYSKKELGEVVIDGLRTLQTRCQELAADTGYIDSLLAEGAARVRPIAEKTLNTVKESVGLG